MKAVLKGCRRLMVKNRENLTTDEQVKLTAMLAASPELHVCYTLEEDFRALFNRPLKREEAEKQLEEWVSRVEASSFKALKKYVGTLRNWCSKSSITSLDASIMALPKE